VNDLAACLWAKDHAPDSAPAEAAYLIEAAALLAKFKRK